jgi:predicted nucleotidyltransferase
VDAPPRTSLFDLAGLELALETAIGVPVDLLTPTSLPPKFRSKVLAEAEPL